MIRRRDESHKTVHLCRQALIPLLFLSAFAASSQKPSSDRWEPAIQVFEENDRQSFPEPGQILFLGSSSIRLWDLQQSFPDLATLNRGFGGSQIVDSTHFADRIVISYKPAAIVLYAGDNDIAAGKTPAQVAEDFRRFVARMRESLPGISIFYISIKPSIARHHLLDQMREANQRIADWSEETEGVEFVDIFGPMLDSDSKPRQELFVADGLHLNQDGYRLWTSILAPYLQRWN